jgi:hypothetical protein
MITFSDDKDMLVGGENVARDQRVIALVGVHECAVVAQKHRMLDEVPVPSSFRRRAWRRGNNELAERSWPHARPARRLQAAAPVFLVSTAAQHAEKVHKSSANACWWWVGAPGSLAADVLTTINAATLRTWKALKV